MTPNVVPFSTPSALPDGGTSPSSTDGLEREVQLDAFICWAMRQSHSGDYSPYQAMQLLNSAWEAQKLLSDLRRQRIIKQA